MSAIVGKAAQHPIVAAHQHDGPTRIVKGAVIAGVGQGFCAAQKEPVLQEQVLALGRKDGGIGIEPRRHRPGPVQRRGGGG